MLGVLRCRRQVCSMKTQNYKNTEENHKPNDDISTEATVKAVETTNYDGTTFCMLLVSRAGLQSSLIW